MEKFPNIFFQYKDWNNEFNIKVEKQTIFGIYTTIKLHRLAFKNEYWVKMDNNLRYTYKMEKWIEKYLQTAGIYDVIVIIG